MANNGTKPMALLDEALDIACELRDEMRKLREELSQGPPSVEVFETVLMANGNGNNNFVLPGDAGINPGYRFEAEAVSLVGPAAGRLEVFLDDPNRLALAAVVVADAAGRGIASVEVPITLNAQRKFAFVPSGMGAAAFTVGLWGKMRRDVAPARVPNLDTGEI